MLDAKGWDTFAVDQNSEPHLGWIMTPEGVCAHFHGNHITVLLDAKVEKEEPLGHRIAVIHSGEIHFKDLRISAARGPQGGVYAAMYSVKPDNKRGVAVVGCSVYGYVNNKYVGVTTEALAYLQEFIEGINKPFDDKLILDLAKTAFPDDETKRSLLVEQMLSRKFKELPWWVQKISLANGKRYNQRDLAVTRRLKKAGLLKDTTLAEYGVATRPGEANIPIGPAEQVIELSVKLVNSHKAIKQ
jgi:hypothetical protein